MSDTITYVLVEVTGVEDYVGVQAAINNLSNAEQQFHMLESQSTTTEAVERCGEPVIYFP